MDPIDDALDDGRDFLDAHAEAVSLALVALAVERRALTPAEGETLVRTADLSDVRAVGGELTLRLERHGRAGELVELALQGRRVLQRARSLLAAREG